jgi:ATP-binding cassette, subfamily A (ABC1), member 3
MALIPRQIAALTVKNLLITLVRHWFSTPFRAFILPCVFVAFLYGAPYDSDIQAC